MYVKLVNPSLLINHENSSIAKVTYCIPCEVKVSLRLYFFQKFLFLAFGQKSCQLVDVQP
jgi:hypothetical protein